MLLEYLYRGESRRLECEEEGDKIWALYELVSKMFRRVELSCKGKQRARIGDNLFVHSDYMFTLEISQSGMGAYLNGVSQRC